jgi:predicted DNA-binding protein YlxM (UPF0122 family)
VCLTLKQKKEVVTWQSEKPAIQDVAEEFCISPSRIYNIQKNKEKLIHMSSKVEEDGVSQKRNIGSPQTHW